MINSWLIMKIISFIHIVHDSSVIDHFWKFISRKLLGFEKGSPLIFYLMDIEKRCLLFYFQFLHFWWTFFMLNIWGGFLRNTLYFVRSGLIENIFRHISLEKLRLRTIFSESSRVFTTSLILHVIISSPSSKIKTFCQTCTDLHR